MEKYKLIGLKPYSGDYNGRKYSGTRCYCTVGAVNYGIGCYSFTVRNRPPEDFRDYLDMDITPIYDRYGNVTDIAL